jgi:hypothetical protein
MRLALLVVLVAACDVGSVLPEGGGGGALSPDASTGVGSGSGSGSGRGSGSPTPQTMQLTFASQSAGGLYNPSHIIAVWIEGAGGVFVKTIERWSNTRTSSLVAWNQKSGGDADAVSGATRSVYAPLTVTWDLKNKQNTVVPDGTYTIRMELADSNATAAGQNNQGTFTFTKGTAPESQTALSNGNFTNVSITFTP